MKLTKTANGYKIAMSKGEWIAIGRAQGWLTPEIESLLQNHIHDENFDVDEEGERIDSDHNMWLKQDLGVNS